MTARILACAVMLCVTGCVSSSADQEAANSAVEACIAQKLPTATQRNQCVNDAENLAPDRFPDLRAVRHAARMALAEKQDKGLISAAEARLEYAKIAADTYTQGESRMAGYRASLPRSITCSTFGSVTTCN